VGCVGDDICEDLCNTDFAPVCFVQRILALVKEKDFSHKINMSATQHNKGNTAAWKEYKHYLLWAFVIGLAASTWCNCASGVKVDHASWNQVKLIRLARAVLDEEIQPQAMESGLLCYKQHGVNQIAMQLCMQQSPAYQAHVAWSLFGRKIVRTCISDAALDLTIAERTNGRVKLDSHLNGCRCLLRQFDVRWGAVLSRGKRLVVRRVVKGVICKKR